MSKHIGLVARASTNINVPIAQVWDALIDPKMIKKYMFGAEVITDWKKESSIIWKGKIDGKHYKDKGIILHIEPHHKLQYSHFSPLEGVDDMPENYHTLTYNLLSTEGDHTLLSLSQDNNPNENARQKSELNWEKMLDDMKELLEK